MRTISILVLGLAVAAAAKRLVTNQSGLTFTLPRATYYMPFNILLFWLLLTITIVLCLLHVSGRMKLG
jgi:hypothetical protein